MEKEPRQSSRGLDSETLSTLEPAGLDNSPAAPGFHPAQKTMNLFILPIMRLERALQCVHPQYYPAKTHAVLYRNGCHHVKVPIIPPFINFSTYPHTTSPHILTSRDRLPQIFHTYVPLYPLRIAILPKHFPPMCVVSLQPVDNLFPLCYHEICSPSTSANRWKLEQAQIFLYTTCG